MTSETFRNQGLFLRNQFQGEGIFEIPIVKKQHISLLANKKNKHFKKQNFNNQKKISYLKIKKK